MAREDFELLAGAEQVQVYATPGYDAKAFCATCGSSLFGGDWPNGDEVSIRLGALDDDPGIRPQYHTYVGSKAAWDEINDALPQHEGPLVGVPQGPGTAEPAATTSRPRMSGGDMDLVNDADLRWEETRAGDAYFHRKNLARAAGGARLGCSLYEVPPGGRDWAYHYHHGNEEAIFVLEGEGLLQTPEGKRPLRRGDYVALPAGAASAHRVHNEGDRPLRFLCMSTMSAPDVTEYPETGKIGVFCGSPPGGDGSERTRSGFYRADKTVGYWD